MDTEQAVQLLESGSTVDRQAVLGRLFEEYRQRLQAAVSFRRDHRLHRRFGVLDVIQDTYMEAQQRIDEYCANPAVPLYVWLKTLAIQRLRQLERHHLRAKKRDPRREVPLPDGSASVPIAHAVLDRKSVV